MSRADRGQSIKYQGTCSKYLAVCGCCTDGVGLRVSSYYRVIQIDEHAEAFFLHDSIAFFFALARHLGMTWNRGKVVCCGFFLGLVFTRITR